MPNKKKQRNAFYFFMKEKQKEYSARGQACTMGEMPNIVGGQWKNLSLAERRKYEQMAAGNKLECQQLDCRLTADGRLVREVEQERVEAEAAELQMRESITNFIGRNRLKTDQFIETNATTKLYFISFNVLCHVKETDSYVPLEVGLVEFTIKCGRLKEYHNIIHPGEIPKGYTGAAMQHSKLTHNISVFGHEGSESNYCKIWQDIIDFIRPRSESDLPPLFCARKDMMQTMGSLEWLAKKAYAEGDLEDIKVWDANFLHMEMRAGAGSSGASYAICEDELLNSTYDYTPGLKCSFHEAEDNINCALRKVKSLCCIISDVMCKLFGVVPTEKHLPECMSSDRPYEVFTPTHIDASGHGRGKPGVSNQNSRPGSALHAGMQYLASRSSSETSRNERVGGITSALSALDVASDESNSESETESSVSSTENLNPQIPPRATGTSSVVQLRQPRGSSYALDLARSRGAPAVVPGKGIGRGQRKV